ncbi:FHA domain-containing protein [Microbacterium aerolatum]|uniref:FHA domain-containing protein n=1 Tax=Microbacterium aerolatum TaxID=153731 RepID=UPI0020017A4A|nr:FHA domain-containing protein [Microbacterium aerolatum]MCK3768741.1 FHA domain-containing protein [Microbacterium aerolatum]
MQTTYRPGDWNVLVAPGALIALSPDAPAELVSTLWERQQSGGDLAAVIDALTDHAAGSFEAVLPFAAVVLEGPDARIAVRGEVTASVTGPDGEESFTGSNVTTWSERFVAGASRLAVTVGEADAGASLPITGGVVRASGATAEIESADVTEPDSAIAAPVALAAPADDAAALDDALTEDASVEESPVEEAAVESPIEEPPVEESPIGESDAEAEPPTAEIPETPAPIDDAVDGATLTPDEVTYATDADEFDQLFGATVASQKPPVPPDPPVPPAPPVPAGDHDGETISVSEARALRQNAPAADPDAPTAVLPVISSASGRIRVSTGQVVTLDRTVIIGRKPRSTRASGADLPHLVAVDSPQQDISRSHLEIRPEGDTVVVVDLHTTNGSTLLRPGADPLRLHPGEQTLVLSDDVVDLGDGVTVTFEDLP